MTHGKNSVHLESHSSNPADVLDTLRDWIAKNLEHGRIKPEIFVKNHVAYRFTLRRGDEEVSCEVRNRI